MPRLETVSSQDARLELSLTGKRGVIMRQDMDCISGIEAGQAASSCPTRVRPRWRFDGVWEWPLNTWVKLSPSTGRESRSYSGFRMTDRLPRGGTDAAERTGGLTSTRALAPHSPMRPYPKCQVGFSLGGESCAKA